MAMRWLVWLSYIMGEAKLLRVHPIDSATARKLVERLHYSGKYVNNSQLHIGVSWQGKLEGVIQLGPPMRRDLILPLVKDTPWNGVMEINRMAFGPLLPRNSESRALGVLIRLLRRKRADIKWLISFSDATQCGDGTIYRAAGFVLTQIAVNKNLVRLPDGNVVQRMSMRSGTATRRYAFAAAGVVDKGQEGLAAMVKAGGRILSGYQLRYIYFLDPAYKTNLTVPTLPFSAIDKAGAGMYKGKRRAASIDSDAATLQVDEGGANPTAALQNSASSSGAAGGKDAL